MAFSAKKRPAKRRAKGPANRKKAVSLARVSDLQAVKAWRHFFVVVLFSGCCLGMAGRVGYLTVTDRDFLQSQGDARSVRSEPIPAHRGVLYDRAGEPLAVSTPVVSVWTDPSRANLNSAGILVLAELIDEPKAKVAAAFNGSGEREFAYLKRRVSWQLAEQIKQLGFAGINFQSEYRRYYPASETTAHVVGVTNVDDAGLEGIELSFNEHLRGEKGEKLVLKDRRGQIIDDLEFTQPPRLGDSLTLSIDLRLQFFAYRELKAAVGRHRAESGSLVMVDAKSGEILALVNQPSYNPNEILADVVGMRNRAVTDVYEPGSTVKPFTVLAALESGEYEPTTALDTAPGYFRVGGKLIEDPINRGVITVAQALQKSSQVGIAKIALALEERAVFNVLARAGIGEYVGTGLPGEVIGRFTDIGLSSPVVRATLAYGYGLAVSPLQLAQAYVTLASGGMKVPLTIVKGLPVPDTVRVFQARQVADVVAMMEQVTDDHGTAPLARVPGYRVAGKTGTSRIVGAHGYDDERHVALFAGFAPVTNPQVVIVVVINEPKGENLGGGKVAAPVFSRVASRALRLLGAQPDQQQLLSMGSK